ncbi:catalase [Arsukibacterium tuosuense]|uniref:Catalase n=1 Tax=Arsukibacterium tuosuense TaxID=1323745 RepID=A0A285I902_9GAMM|nr:catalase [Arsukibacterium tuosuense]SNY44460.1 catalase [Arsukibacterium tuosuense]
MATKKMPDGKTTKKHTSLSDKTSDISAENDGLLMTNYVVAKQAKAAEDFVAATPYNNTKATEYGLENASTPPAGATATPDSAALTASSSTEHSGNAKTGDAAPLGSNATTSSLERARVDDSDQPLTTNQGVRLSDNQNTLKVGLRGPSLLEDFILREKITHFDHERIPERVVHARGSAAHGYFEAYDEFTKYTCAAPFSEKGKVTPVFVRFSTVAGERGSKDTARDARGFAVKFYTDEGNWDLVGNNIPVFFIQDAMKFPDLVHAVKPEPHHGMPQAASAHDTFWDFVSLMPESTHMLMWIMSDRGIPRSYRMMQGFGVHTFRLVNEQGESVFCKFHWKPLLGTHSLVWDEAVKISGADPDFHRRDLWEAIESGQFPEWELGLQIFSEQQADSFSFDVLDATKLIPEELVPLIPVGRMVLNRNPDNFFAETEQVAFCTAHIIPGIDFSNDPLLAGRIHSYVDTQITRLGGPNFHEIPINSPLASLHNNQRDGLHRQAINRGRVAYEPNSLGGGCPFQAGASNTAARGFSSFPETVSADKVRGKPEKFAEHYAQARLFFNSQTEVEQTHIIAAFRFELSKVEVAAIRERMLSSLLNVSEELAAKVAAGLGMTLPKAMPKAFADPPEPEVIVSLPLSLTAHPGDAGISSRQIAVLIEDDADHASLVALHSALTKADAVVHFVGPRVGVFSATNGKKIAANKSMENSPSVLFDALVLTDGRKAVQALSDNPDTMAFIKDAFRHGKTILALGAAKQLLDMAGIKANKDDDKGVLLTDCTNAAGIAPAFINAIAAHRHLPRMG